MEGENQRPDMTPRGASNRNATLPPDRLVEEAATGALLLTEVGLQRIRAHVASVGFDPAATSRVGLRAEGAVWRGQAVRAGDRLVTEVVHYLRHVRRGMEWPSGTTRAEYLESLRQTVLDPDGGIYVERRFGAWELTFVARSGRWRGESGGEWILVGYSPGHGFWVTGFQPDRGLDYVTQRPDGTDGRWLRRPRGAGGSI